MPYWLARQRDGQDFCHIQRFDPRFWTVNFPRPMMASVVTTAPDALRVDAVFYDRDALAGLIWDSADSLDHPLLAYATDRDYQRTTLQFRWRSAGVKPLDAVHGPTLTIDGRDASGNPRSWYVRLWNYATGTPEDAQIALSFSALDGGFLLPGEADRVHPGDIDRMFISLVPPDYDGTGGALVAPAEGWVEISDLVCEGHRAMLEIGDAVVPPHGLSVATGYDDSFNQTPARLLRNIRQLGYRGPINHYVGMSHYFRLVRDGANLLVDLSAGSLNAPCARWHRDLCERARAAGQETILSLSYELFDAHCPEDWKQRAENGDPALTGWVPPSTLLSPANAAAMAYLRAVATAFAEIQRDAGLPVRFQIGEPWWWIMPDGRICLYDAAATDALGALSVSIPTIHGPQTAVQQAMLDAAGELLAASTASLAEALRAAVAPLPAEIALLVYLPSVLDQAAPEAQRANVPIGWAWPAYDVLQLEDYDWVTAERFSAQRRALGEMDLRLGYPAAQQHYFSGFVLNAADETHWRAITRAVEDAATRGPSARFIWALPQICRDGFTYFRLQGDGEDDMQAFDDVLFPLALGRDASTSGSFATQVVTGASGHERRNSQWADARLGFDAGPGIRSEAELAGLMAFFRARRGAGRGFRFRDSLDFSSNAMTGAPTPFDVQLGIGDGVRSEFALRKLYGDGSEPQERRITRPVAASVRVSVDGAELTTGWSLEPLGTVAFDDPPASGADVRAGFLFDVPVRFAEDRLELSAATFLAGDIPSVPLVEIREAV